MQLVILNTICVMGMGLIYSWNNVLRVLSINIIARDKIMIIKTAYLG
jgi:hypothetical protein